MRIPGLILVLICATGALAQAPATIKVNTQLVVVNVSVTDSHNNAIRDLDASHFKVTEVTGIRGDDVPQKIVSVEEHSVPDPINTWALPKLPPGVYSNIPASPMADALTVLLLDSQGTSPGTQLRVHNQLVRFVRESPLGIRIAIFRFGPQLQLIEGFTADRERLVEALNRPESYPLPPIQNPRPDLEEGSEFEQLTRFLERFPGRKNIIWFAGSFPTQDPFDLNQNILFGELNFLSSGSTTDDKQKLGIRDIVLYPVDPEGVQPPPMFDVRQDSRLSLLPADEPRSDRTTALAQTAMDVLARETGGKAFYNGNNLAAEIGKAISLGSNYYTVAYQPARTAADGSTRHLTVQVKAPGAHLAYRHSYLATPTPPAPAVEPPARLGVERGSPDATQILFRTSVLPLATQPPAGAEPAGELGARLKGPRVRYALDWAADLHGINAQRGNDGLHHAVVTVTAVAYDDHANPLNSISTRVEDKLTPDQYDAALAGGLQYHQQLDLPLGTVFLRLVLVDGKGRTGATEVPLTVSEPPAAPAAAR